MSEIAGPHCRAPLADTDVDNFSEALANAGNDMSRDFGIPFELDIGGERRMVHRHIGEAVYRIGRESFLNAFQSDGTTRVFSRLNFGSETLQLTVRDNGFFDPAQAPGDHDDGLAADRSAGEMEARARRAGASLAVHARPHGTEVVLDVPATLAYCDAGMEVARKLVPGRPDMHASGM